MDEDGRRRRECVMSIPHFGSDVSPDMALEPEESRRERKLGATPVLHAPFCRVGFPRAGCSDSGPRVVFTCAQILTWLWLTNRCLGAAWARVLRRYWLQLNSSAL